MDLSALADSQIIAAALAPDATRQKQGRELLYRRFERLVWHAISRAGLRFGAAEEDLADAFQEAWVRILEKLPLYGASKGEVSGFLWTVAFRCAFSFFRSSLSKEPMSLAEGVEATTTEWEGIEVVMDVSDCLSQLEDQAADAVLMWTQGFTGREIGEPLGLNAVQTFQKLIHPAIRLLQRCMGTRGYAVAAN
jgi:RNA polymerase sigma factor (sigma-70 family)